MATDPAATALSKEYDTPLGLAHTTAQALKDRIKKHYDVASDYYNCFWGEHIHHGYWPEGDRHARDSKEKAQVNLVRLLLEMSALPEGSSVLDVGCGIGGTARFLADQWRCEVTGITISTRQVVLARHMSAQGGAGAGDGDGEQGGGDAGDGDGFMPYVAGKVRFLEADAERMSEVFGEEDKFDAVWICEALSHFPNKELFFENAFKVLKPSGRLIMADWFKDVDVDKAAFDRDIKPIEDGMLLPPLCTQPDYVSMAQAAGFSVLAEPRDISKQVSRTWDVSWSLVQAPSLWAFAFSQGRDGIAFLQSFLAMRRAYGNGTFRYAVMAFTK